MLVQAAPLRESPGIWNACLQAREVYCMHIKQVMVGDLMVLRHHMISPRGKIT
jgi:hypothetical protein